MLQVFRQGIGSWFVKGFMGLLIFAFVIWGIADVFRNFGASTLARVGKTQISAEGFRGIFTERLQQLSRRLGRPITPAQAQILGLDRQILGELLREAKKVNKERHDMIHALWVRNMEGNVLRIRLGKSLPADVATVSSLVASVRGVRDKINDYRWTQPSPERRDG